MRLPDRSTAEGLRSVENELARVEMLLDGVLRLASAEHRLTEQNSEEGVADSTAEKESINVLQVLAEEFERQSATAQAKQEIL